MTLADLIRDRVGAQPDRACLAFEGRSWTYAQLYERACRLAALAPARGSHIGVLSDNLPDAVAAIWSAALRGGVCVVLSPDHDGDELAADIALTDVDHLIVDPRYAVLLEDSIVETFVAAGRFWAIDRDAPEGLVEPSESLDASLLLASPDDPDVAPLPSDLAMIAFGPGADAPARAVRITHARLTRNAQRSAERLRLGPDDRHYVPRPLCDICAVESGPVAALTANATLVLGRRFAPHRFAADVALHDVTSFTYSGSMPARLVAAGVGVQGLRGLGSGAPAEVVRRFPADLIDVFESAETGAVDDDRLHVGSDGTLQADATFDGYWSDDIAARDLLRDGLVKTGLAASPSAIESAVYARGDAVECAAYDVPAPDGLRQTMLSLVLRPGVEFGVEVLGDVRPMWVRVVRAETGLPATVTGRVRRDRLSSEKFLLDLVDDPVYQLVGDAYVRLDEDAYLDVLRAFAKRGTTALLHP